MNLLIYFFSGAVRLQFSFWRLWVSVSLCRVNDVDPFRQDPPAPPTPSTSTTAQEGEKHTHPPQWAGRYHISQRGVRAHHSSFITSDDQTDAIAAQKTAGKATHLAPFHRPKTKSSLSKKLNIKSGIFKDGVLE